MTVNEVGVDHRLCTALSELGERTCSGGRGPWTGRRGAEGGRGGWKGDGGEGGKEMGRGGPV